MATLSRLKERYISFHLKHIAAPFSLIEYLAARFIGALGARRLSMSLCLASIRHGYRASSVSYLSKKYIEQLDTIESLSSPPCSEAEFLNRMIILSPPRVEDKKFIKGVILIKFTTTFSYLPKHSSWDKLNRMFLFVLEPSWSGYADADILLFLAKADHCIVQASEIRDRALLNIVSPRTPCLDIGSGNWVDHTVFNECKERSGKSYDVTYIANLNPIKRVYKLIDDIAKETVSDPDFNALIVCSDWGSSSLYDLKNYVFRRRLTGNISIEGRKSHEEVAEILRQSKCSILLSLKEGSNRAVFESMFCDTPVICLSENIGVNKSYINCFTGILTTDDNVSSTLRYMKNNYQKFTPRAWALENISAHASIARLKACILSYFDGEAINTDMKVKMNTPEANYFGENPRKLEINKYLMSEIGGADISLISAQLEGLLGPPKDS